MMNESSLYNLYNKFLKVHNQFTAVKRSSVINLNDTLIYPIEIEVLKLIYHDSSLSITDISKELYITKSGASQIVKKLYIKKLLTKHRYIENERLVKLEMTEKGTDLLNDYFKNNEELDIFFKNISSLSSPEIETISNFLNMMDNSYSIKLK